jgi:FKBP-type peptidyl-prolyl cis-trans isomerase
MEEVATGDVELDPTKLTKLPVKKTDFSIIGKKAQLQVAVALTSQEPDIHDFDNYPLPSSKQIALEKAKAEAEAAKAAEEAKQAEEEAQKRAAAMEAAAKPKRKSTTKIEQISTLTNDVVRIWANAEDASSVSSLFAR